MRPMPRTAKPKMRRRQRADEIRGVKAIKMVKPRMMLKRKQRYKDHCEIRACLPKRSGTNICYPTFLRDHGALTAFEGKGRTHRVSE